jgi:hypothetical protein
MLCLSGLALWRVNFDDHIRSEGIFQKSEFRSIQCDLYPQIFNKFMSPRRLAFLVLIAENLTIMEIDERRLAERG